MAKYKVIAGGVITPDKKVHLVGDVVELDDTDGARCVGNGTCEPMAKVVPPAPATPSPVEDKGKK